MYWSPVSLFLAPASTVSLPTSNIRHCVTISGMSRMFLGTVFLKAALGNTSGIMEATQSRFLPNPKHLDVILDWHIVTCGKFHRIGGAPPKTFPNVKYDVP